MKRHFATVATFILLSSKILRAQNSAFVTDNLQFSRDFYANIHFVAIAKTPASFAYDRYPAAESERIRCDEGTYARQRGKPWLKSEDWAETGRPADARIVRRLQGWIKLINDAMTLVPESVKLVSKSVEDGRNQWLIDATLKGEKTKSVRLRFAKPLYETDEDVLLHGFSASMDLLDENPPHLRPVEFSFGYLIPLPNGDELSERAWEDLNTPKAGAMVAAPVRKPTDAAGYEERGKEKGRKGELAGAIVDFNRAIALDPKLGAAYYERGFARRSIHDFDGAITDFDRVIALDPKNPDPFNERGIAKRRKGDFAGAIADYSHAIELNPKASELSYFNRALSKDSLKDPAGAMADYTSVIELNPKNANAYNNRGNLRRKANDLGGAIADFSKALEINPKLALAYKNRGQANQAKGDAAAAAVDLKHAAELESGD